VIFLWSQVASMIPWSDLTLSSWMNRYFPVISVGFIILIGIQYIPSISTGGGPVALWVEIVSRVVLLLRMAVGLVSTLLRTLPGLVPVSWWISGTAVMGFVVVLWVSMVRRHLRNQGVDYE
ncbi:MAG: hypothetical protein P8Y68_15275, partial [Anaerolineales bacterium]